MDDQDILALYFARNEAAIAESSAKYGSYCGHIAYNVLADRQDSEECLNDAWLSAWNSIPPQQPQSLRAYLGALVRNAALNLYQRNHAKKRSHEMDLLLSELDECIPDSSTVEQAVDAALVGSTVSAWLRGLTPGEQRLFLRRYWYGEAVNALARQGGVTPNAISSKLKRLRQELRTHLEKEGIRI